MKLKVMSKQCNECLFSKNKIISDEKKENLLNECWRSDTHFVCHKFTIAGQDGVCKGFWDNYQTALMGLAKASNMVELVNPDELKE